MQRSSFSSKAVFHQILRHKNQIQRIKPQPCDVFINHRGIDTKRNVAGLLYDHLSRLKFRPFLDSKNLKPGDKLFDKIDTAIRHSKMGIAVFSPTYCDSYFCLHELSLIMETKKKVIPIFCDVKPSELRVKDNGGCLPNDLQRFSRALEEAKYTVGLTFDTLTGDWPDFLASATDAVMKNMMEIEGDRMDRKQKNTKEQKGGSAGKEDNIGGSGSVIGVGDLADHARRPAGGANGLLGDASRRDGERLAGTGNGDTKAAVLALSSAI
ncbi:unnamed protein product [Ilex paraguariensis]|uniref:TIR domain-containing protein n=1 Tax=Ilex paraguariensis TaxID=185542 RepID=A0ABC8QV70_9AQUA